MASFSSVPPPCTLRQLGLGLDIVGASSFAGHDEQIIKFSVCSNGVVYGNFFQESIGSCGHGARESTWIFIGHT